MVGRFLVHVTIYGKLACLYLHILEKMAVNDRQNADPTANPVNYPRFDL